MSRLEHCWQYRGGLACLLWPVSLLYSLVLTIRRRLFAWGVLRTQVSTLPVVVIGNLSIGGTGKTPLCAELLARFQAAGWTPGIVSRGYGGHRWEEAHLLGPGDTPATVGDEPLMLFQQCRVPVCVCIHRALAVKYLAEHTDIDIVFSDDGLQHLEMSRAANIVVIDGARGLGNRWLLPAGPLRESPKQLEKADLVAIQVPFTRSEEPPQSASLHSSLLSGYCGQTLASSRDQYFQLLPDRAISLYSGESCELSIWQGQRVHAVAGIGNPQRFFDSLEALGLQVDSHPMPDHHAFSLADLTFADAAPILVTSKDAVKLRALTGLPTSVYEVCTRIQCSDQLYAAIDHLERSLRE